MIRLDLPLIGPALALLPALRLQARRDRVSTLLHGLPGTGKSHLLDLLAAELTGGVRVTIESLNGQSLDVATGARHNAADLFSGVNMGAAVKDAEAFCDAREARKLAA